MEGINNKIKLIKRQDYGFTKFDNFRSRLLAAFEYKYRRAKKTEVLYFAGSIDVQELHFVVFAETSTLTNSSWLDFALILKLPNNCLGFGIADVLA